VLSANHLAAAALERKLEELTNSQIEDVLAPIDWLLAQAGSQGARRACLLDLPSGRRITVGFTLGVAEAKPGNDCYAVLFRDISEVVTLREERDRLLKIAGVGSALPTLFHEIKTPLASITAAVEILIEEMEPGSVRDQIGAVLSEVRRMKLSLDGVAAIGRNLRGQRYSAIDLVCRDAWQVMAARAQSLGIHSRCHVENMPLLLLDPAVVGAIVHNLMINAIQACSPGQSVNLQAGLGEGGTHFTVAITDNGSGMSSEVYSRCTELFFSTKRNGSGIGLALCRRAAEEAGGTLTIQSVIGFGTSVTVDVPIPHSNRVSGPKENT
jgi:signal transduction histidine kinase